MDYIDETKHLHLTDRPAEAMSFNGQYLEDIAPGYKTVNVMGRETLPLAIQTSGPMPARDGEIMEDTVAGMRTIAITYSLTADSDAAFRQAYNLMKHHLMKTREAVPITFTDDPDYTYYGVASNVPEVEPGLNKVIGEIAILCADPYKYSGETTVSGTNIITFSPTGLTQDVRPIIKVTLASSATKIVVSNITTGKKIILNGTYVSGDVIDIDANAGTVKRNGGSIKSHLDFIESDFFRFLVRPGDQVSITPSTSNIQLTYRRRLL